MELGEDNRRKIKAYITLNYLNNNFFYVARTLLIRSSDQLNPIVFLC